MRIRITGILLFFVYLLAMGGGCPCGAGSVYRLSACAAESTMDACCACCSCSDCESQSGDITDCPCSLGAEESNRAPQWVEQQEQKTGKNTLHALPAVHGDSLAGLLPSPSGTVFASFAERCCQPPPGGRVQGRAPPATVA